MQADYKFRRIKRDKGYIVQCFIYFGEGEVMDVPDLDINDNPVVVNRYMRTAHLTDVQMSILGEGFGHDGEGVAFKIYTDEDFGRIKTDDELRVFLNLQLLLFSPGRTPNVTQAITDLDTMIATTGAK